MLKFKFRRYRFIINAYYTYCIYLHKSNHIYKIGIYIDDFIETSLLPTVALDVLSINLGLQKRRFINPNLWKSILIFLNHWDGHPGWFELVSSWALCSIWFQYDKILRSESWLQLTSINPWKCSGIRCIISQKKRVNQVLPRDFSKFISK